MTTPKPIAQRTPGIGTIVGLPTFLGILVVLIAGGVLTVLGDVSWDHYMESSAAFLGLNSLAHGVDQRSRP